MRRQNKITYNTITSPPHRSFFSDWKMVFRFVLFSYSLSALLLCSGHRTSVSLFPTNWFVFYPISSLRGHFEKKKKKKKMKVALSLFFPPFCCVYVCLILLRTFFFLTWAEEHVSFSLTHYAAATQRHITFGGRTQFPKPWDPTVLFSFFYSFGPFWTSAASSSPSSPSSSSSSPTCFLLCEPKERPRCRIGRCLHPTVFNAVNYAFTAGGGVH